jgi:hypothetical protein
MQFNFGLRCCKNNDTQHQISGTIFTFAPNN